MKKKIASLESQITLLDSALYDIARDAAIALDPPKFKVGDRVRFNMNSSMDDQGYIGRIVVRNMEVMSRRSTCNKYKYVAKYNYVIIRDGDDCVYNDVVEWEIIDLSIELLTVTHIRGLFPELNECEAAELLLYSKDRTICYKDCFGNGQRMYDEWKKFKNESTCSESEN